MRQRAHARPTIGFLSTWSVYQGTTIDSCIYALLQGICATARERDCNLLLGCGISLPVSPCQSRTAWPELGAGVDFVPVGLWDADGLIVILGDLSDVQLEYLQDLLCSGFPVILTIAEKPGPLVAVDNAGGIRQAFDHLLQHGHWRIAFIAGKSGHGGDTAERLAAYHDALRDTGIEEDARLIAFGEHRREDGRAAMQQILSTRAPFTAMLASNDLSCLGAMQALREAGRRIPEDVAVIGFDDIIRPGLLTSGGMLETKRIADYAECHSIPTALHFTGSPIAFMANLHTAAAIPSFIALEHHGLDLPFWSDLVTGLADPLLEDGYVAVPEKPGLGVDLNYEGIKANLRDFSGLFEPTDYWNTPKLGFWQPDRRWDK